MSLPELEVAKGWAGRTVLSSDGRPAGQCTAVYADDATGQPEWLAVHTDRRDVLVPVRGAVPVGEDVSLAFLLETIEGAPSTAEFLKVTKDEEGALYAHYGLSSTAADGKAVTPDEEPAVVEEEPAVVEEEPAISDELSPAAAEAPSPDRVGVLLRIGLGLFAAIGAVLLGRRLLGRRAAPAPVAVRARDAARAAAASSAPVIAGGARTTGRLAGSVAQQGLRAGLTAAALATMGAQAAAPRVAYAGHRVADAGRDAASSVARIGMEAGSAAAETIEDIEHTWRKTMRKLTMALGLGVGYVLGARAGRERYETIKAKAAGLLERPEVQQAQERIKGVVGDKLPHSAHADQTTAGADPYIDLNAGSDATTHPERM